MTIGYIHFQRAPWRVKQVGYHPKGTSIFPMNYSGIIYSGQFITTFPAGLVALNGDEQLRVKGIPPKNGPLNQGKDL